jgi:hypothetical protein
MSFNGKFPPGLFPRDLVADWRFHPSEPLADSTYNGLNLTNSNATQGLVNVHDGYYYSFNGSNSALSAGSPAKLDNLFPVTYEGWINPTGAGEGTFGQIYSKSDGVDLGTGGIEIGMDGISTAIYFDVGLSTTFMNVETDNVVTEGSWNHIAITWDGSVTATNSHIYINGVEANYTAQDDGVGTHDDSSLSATIGNYASGTYTFDGLIGPLRIWNKVLTPTQIGWVYNKGR